MKIINITTRLALLFAGALGTFGQTIGLGINFASTDPDAATSSLAPEEFAGVIPQANWNNLTGATGTSGVTLKYDNNGTATPSTASVTWSSPNTWRSGGNNLFPAGSSDQKLLSGYLDTGNAATNGISITVSNLDSAVTADAYDVYVYFVSDSNADRGGAYTIDDGNGPVVKYGSTMGSPSAYTEDPGTDQNISIDGNYLRFRRLTGKSFTLKTDTTLTTPNGFRAPINAIQIVPSPIFGPDILTEPRSVEVFSGRTVHFNTAVDGFPAITSLRWKKDGDDLTDGGRVSGATTTSLVISNAVAADAGVYTLTAVSSRGSVTTQPATLTIVPQENSDYVTALVAAAPLASWRLNEPGNETNVFDPFGGLTGRAGDDFSARIPVEGPRSPEFSGFTSTNDSTQFPGLVEVPTPVLNTNTVTLLAWIKPSSAQANYTGLIMTRSGTQAGLGYTTDNQLGYTWNNNSTYTWNSGVRPPDNQWSMVAIVISSNKATLYLGNSGTLKAVINPIAHTSETWGGTARIGDDLGGTGRGFFGAIDEVSVFNRALSFTEVADLYEAATGIAQTPPPDFSIQPVSQTRYEGATIQLSAVVASAGPATFQWKKGTANVVNGGRISGATNDTLVITGATAADAGDYTLTATNPNGSTVSAIATVTVAPATNAYAKAVLSLHPLAFWRLNEAGDPFTGSEQVIDWWGGHNGTYGSFALNSSSGIEGPRPAQGFNAFEADNGALRPTVDTADSWATVGGPGVTTNSITIMAWINPATLVTNAGIVFARAGQPATGLDLGGATHLGYHWLDNSATYSWDSGITVPIGEWSLVAIAVEPDRAVAYMINKSGLTSATNAVAHAARAFTDAIRIGGDPNNVNRTFDGSIDEVAIFGGALSASQLQALFNGQEAASDAHLQISGANGALTITWDQAGTLQSTTALQGAATVWKDEAASGNTLAVTPEGTAKFYRLKR